MEEMKENQGICLFDGNIETENIVYLSRKEIKQLLKNKIIKVERNIPKNLPAVLPLLPEDSIKINIVVSELAEERTLRKNGYKPSIFSPFIKQWH